MLAAQSADVSSFAIATVSWIVRQRELMRVVFGVPAQARYFLNYWNTYRLTFVQPVSRNGHKMKRGCLSLTILWASRRHVIEDAFT